MTELAWVRGNVPTEEGWYRVLHPGDSESIDGHTIYAYGDYQGWAYWNPEVDGNQPISNEIDFRLVVVEAPCDAHWSCEHDEEGEFIIAFCGPLVFPDLPSDLKS